MNGAQKVGAQVITGAFATVGTAIEEAEASIRTIRQRHAEKATKLWVSLRTLPQTNPLARLSIREYQRLNVWFSGP